MRNAVRFDLLWVFGGFFCVLILSLYPMRSEDSHGMQTKRRFWIMLSQMQCEVSGCPMGCSSLDSSDTM